MGKQTPIKAIRTKCLDCCCGQAKWDDCGTATDGTKELQDIFGYKAFDTPKPIGLIKKIISLAGSEDATVLDFFVGSGTTGQAVFELNNEDGGHRKAILCTNNEGNICNKVTYPRLKTVITGQRVDGSKYSEGITTNLVYYKSDYIKNSNNTDQAKYSLVEKVDELLCISEGIYVCKERTAFSSHYATFDNGRHLFIYSDYYNVDQFNSFISSIKITEGEKVVYMFSTDNMVDKRLFEGINDVNVKPIPSKIYEIYKEIVEDIKRGEQ